MTSSIRLIVLGRQGAGKGTQCARLAARLAVPHISTGDLFRAEAAKGSDVGRQVAAHLDAGSLVPDDLVLDLVATRLGNRQARQAGYLLDGFPRTLVQGQTLFEVLGTSAADVAVELHVPTSVVLPRLAARRVCQDCGTNYSVPDGAEEITQCPKCGGKVTRRSDDTDEAIARRLAAYDRESGPLLDWLDGLGLLVRVDGVGDPDDVHRRLLAAVRSRVPGVDG
ncbi:MAG TPA: nucleoside monophosphate kinase [Acidimicrobiales bacterium]|nr:nucleoside monophosphate kinase [Acidimicrobiales bacterium]